MENKNRVDTREAVNVFIRISFIGILFIWSFTIIKPLFMITLWGIIIAVSSFPLHKRFTKILKGRDKLSAILLVVIGLIFVISPVILFMDSTIESLGKITESLEAGTLTIPQVSEEIKGIPVLGEKIAKLWILFTGDFRNMIEKIAPQLQIYASKILGIISTLGIAIVQFILSIFIGGILLINAEVCSRGTGKIFKILIGEFVEGFHEIAAGTIRSVVQGVVGIAIIQAVFAGIGMLAVGVPGAGIWSILVMILAIIQLPPMVILVPVAVYVYSKQTITIAVLYIIWSIFVGILDNVLKPFILGRGVDIPMLVILLGSLGGMVTYGIIGLFVGPVILALGYKFMIALVERDDMKNRK
ncbi:MULTISPECIES: AI-2E family transporter [Psychrilyobacter]|uniref:AI-2E family transporter n=1 Tax=Psychrilyobacter TaxID=623282 RepID=UPI00131439A6|nr:MULTISPECIES: AI-2E family transporter [Psychrilyobacter]MCS5422466.1 AI-2E family transporter [Psychrilyobacter sp. S5]NDI78364.1 AI-2E family transporter [Psychrilyobacter piezotolerans]